MLSQARDPLAAKHMLLAMSPASPAIQFGGGVSAWQSIVRCSTMKYFTSGQSSIQPQLLTFSRKQTLNQKHTNHC